MVLFQSVEKDRVLWVYGSKLPLPRSSGQIITMGTTSLPFKELVLKPNTKLSPDTPRVLISDDK